MKRNHNESRRDKKGLQLLVEGKHIRVILEGVEEEVVQLEEGDDVTQVVQQLQEEYGTENTDVAEEAPIDNPDVTVADDTDNTEVPEDVRMEGRRDRPVTFSKDFRDGSSVYGTLFPNGEATVSYYDSATKDSIKVPVNEAVFSTLKGSSLKFEVLRDIIDSYARKAGVKLNEGRSRGNRRLEGKSKRLEGRRNKNPKKSRTRKLENKRTQLEGLLGKLDVVRGHGEFDGMVTGKSRSFYIEPDSTKDVVMIISEVFDQDYDENMINDDMSECYFCVYEAYDSQADIRNNKVSTLVLAGQVSVYDDNSHTYNDFYPYTYFNPSRITIEDLYADLRDLKLSGKAVRAITESQF